MTPILENAKLTRKALLALPHRKWDLESTYDTLLILPSGRKHDSGFALEVIVGVNYGLKGQPREAELAATCDDINWGFPLRHPYDAYGKTAGASHSVLRTDCIWPAGILHFWASGEHYFRGRFKVGLNVSSTDVTLVLVPNGDTTEARRLFESRT